MAISFSPPARRRNRSASAPSARPSVREVCLLGVSGPSRAGRPSEGDRVAWSGRSYRVEARAADYLHLAPAVEG